MHQMNFIGQLQPTRVTKKSHKMSFVFYAQLACNDKYHRFYDPWSFLIEELYFYDTPFINKVQTNPMVGEEQKNEVLFISILWLFFLFYEIGEWVHAIGHLLKKFLLKNKLYECPNLDKVKKRSV